MSKLLLTLAILACSGVAAAQSAGSTGQSSNAGASASSSAGGAGSGKAGSGKAGGGAGGISSADAKMLSDLAEANIAEIQTGKLALEKGKSEQAKSFAQKMIDDHTAALQQLQTLAQSKGVKLPEDTDLQHKAIATALKPLSGDTFDSQYVKRVGVGDHERTVKLLQKVQQNAQDPELKAMAGKMLPTVQQHLQMAQKLSTATSAKK
jgi:putative membrane protein